MMASRTAARPVDATPQIAVHELEERLVRGAINVLGVRQPAEWHAGHIPGASYVTGAELPDPLGEVPEDHCLEQRRVPRRAVSKDNDRMPERMHEMMNGMMGWGWFGVVLGLLILLLLVACLTAGLVHLLRALRGPHAGGTAAPETSSRSQSASQVLDERYARGEIDHDDYEQRRYVLGR